MDNSYALLNDVHKIKKYNIILISLILFTFFINIIAISFVIYPMYSPPIITTSTIINKINKEEINNGDYLVKLIKNNNAQFMILYVSKQIFKQTGKFPESLDELMNFSDQNIQVPTAILKNIPLDPWGNRYLYKIVNGKPKIICLGSDNAVGGNGEAEDIVRSLE